MTRILFVVARDQPELYERARQSFEDFPEVEVIADRRRGPYRSHNGSVPDEHRGGELRRRNVDALLRNPGWVVVRLTEPET